MDFNFLKENQLEEQLNEIEEQTAELTAVSFSEEGPGLLRYARFLVYILVFLVPLFFLPWTSEILEFNKQFLIFVLGVVGLILYLSQVIRTGHLVIKKSIANYAALVFIATSALASIFSDLRYQSIFGGFNAGFSQSFISSAGFAVFFFLVLNVFGIQKDSLKKDISKLLTIFGFSLFLTLILGGLEMFRVPLFELVGITQGVFNTAGTFNSLGILAALLLVISFYEFDDDFKYLKYIKLPAALVSLLVLAILNWWILWVAGIAGLVLVLVSRSLKNWKILNYFWPLAIILVAVVFILLNFNISDNLKTSQPVEIAPSFKASFGISRGALTKDPLFGVGPENFSLAYDLYKPLSINNTVFWNLRFSEATSEMFNALTSYGIVGFLAVILLFGAGFKLGRKNYGLLSVFAVLAAAWVLYPYNMTLSFSFWLLLGLIALGASREDDKLVIALEKSPKHSLITSVSFVSLLILAVVGFYFVTLRFMANLKFASAFSVPETDKQIQLVTEAINLDKNEDLYSRSLAGLLSAKINRETQNLNGASTEERQNILGRIQNFSASAINLSTGTTARHPNNLLNWSSRASVYENLIGVVDGSADWAVKMYEEYSKVSPRDPVPFLKIGNIYLSQADFMRQVNPAAFKNQIAQSLNSAEENYLKAVSLKPNYVLAIYSLGVVYERQGRIKDTITQLELTKSANPLDANIALQLGLLYYRNNQKDKSFAELQRAITIFSDFSNARWYLALVYEERGQIDEALRELGKIRVLNPDNEILLNKIKELEEGKRSIPPGRVTGIQPLE